MAYDLNKPLVNSGDPDHTFGDTMSQKCMKLIVFYIKHLDRNIVKMP